MRNNNYPDNLEIVANQKIKEKKYWLEKLSGEWTKSSFPYSFKKEKQGQLMALQPWKFSFSKELFHQLMKLSAGTDVRLYIVLAAGLVVLISKYTGSSDIIIGSPIYKQDINSKFVNTVLVLRNQLRHHVTFKELLLQVRQTIIEANDNCNYPVAILAKQLGRSYRERDYFPLFDMVILLENIHEKTYIQHINCNIRFFFKRTGEGIEGVLEYNPLLYDRWTIEKIIHHFMHVFQHVLVNLDVKISGIEILSADEKKHILEDFNKTASPYPKDKTIHELFAEQAEKKPDGVAVIGEEQIVGAQGAVPLQGIHLTYGELNKKSNQLAEVLREKGVLTDDIVAIMVERSIEMIIGILGILKAGGAYLPIDPGCPEERKQYMLADSGARVLVSELSEVSMVSEGTEVVTHLTHPTHLCYIIYTSGTTGRPKAILTTHANVIRVVRDTNYIEFQPRDRVLQLSDYAFDGSVFDIFGALLNGCTLVMVSREDILEIETLCRLIERERISVFFVTTALFNTIVDVGLESLSGIRKVLFGGERVSVNHAAKALAYLGRNRILHMYGPTETTVYATYYSIDAVDENQITIPIGAPVSNTWIYILDDSFTLVPIGVTGEIYIGGPGVCRGYMNNPELTAEKFILAHSSWLIADRREKKVSSSGKLPMSYELSAMSCLYKTGDLGRWLNDGNIEFIGRVDHQVKVRGFRIELGEVESRLLNYMGIKECTVTAVEDEKGSRYLCAYIVGDEKIEISQLKDYLSQFLPGFMVPSYFVRVDKIPLGNTGKIDRSKLPDPRMSPGENYAAPRDEIEEKLVEIWSRVLGDAKTIGIDDDFFDLGGHSLKATVMAAQIHRQLHVKVPLEVVFKNPTIRELSQYTRKSSKEEFAWIAPVEQKEYYPLSAAQKRLYIMQHMGVDYVSYNQFMVIVLAGNVQKEKLQQTFRKLIRRHESLRTSFEIVEDEPVQRIHQEENYKFQITNSKLKHIENFLRPFDLSKAPLLRVGLIETGDREYILILDMHHIISDGTSLDIFAREFVALYSGKELPGLRIQYKDFAQWQNRLAAAGEIDRQEAYWLRQFAGGIPRLNLPGNSGDASTFSNEGSTLIFEVGKELTLKIKNLISAAGTTTYMVLLAIYNILLSKYTSQEDIVVGSGIAGRRHADLQHVIGMFVNMLPMRNRPQENKTFLEFLREVKENALNAYENQDYQFDQLVEKLKVKREPGRNPIFDTQFTFQNLVNQVDEEDSPVNKMDFKIKPYEPEDRKINMQFDLSLSGVETTDNIIMTLEYVKTLFTHSYARGMTEHFIEILKQVIENRHVRLKGINISHELQAVESVLKEEDVFDYEF